MVRKSKNVLQVDAMTDVPAMTLQQYCPDLEDWPQRWKFDGNDIAPGQAIVEFFKPFLLSLLSKNLSLKILRRDRDHLWLLGGELIRRRYDDPKLMKIPTHKAIGFLIEEDGGPLIWPRITQTEQSAFDATCRKLYRYLNSDQIPV